MVLLLDWLLPIKIQDNLQIIESYSKVNSYLLFEVLNLLLIKPTVNKCLTNHNDFKSSSYDFSDIYFYLTLQSIPKVYLKFTEPAKIKSNIYILNHSILYCD